MLTAAARRAVASAAAAPIPRSWHVEGRATGAQTVIQADKHRVIIDEPARIGGKDEGPSPLNTLLASLAGCKTATLKQIAKEMGVTFTTIDYKVDATLDLRGFMGVPGVKSRFHTVVLDAVIDTTATAEQVAKMAELVHTRCPVANLMADAGVDLKVTMRKK